MKTQLVTSALLLITLASGALAQNIATTRNAALNQEPEPPRMTPVENKDIRRKRAYPMQPPTIPHKIDNYQVDINANKCMSCHSRKQSEDTQAPMVSVTHYMDRDGNFLADISARRYFCNQCHVVQHEVKPTLENQFEDVDTLLRASRK
jgi:cytochrome c-type protein NapB